MTVNIVLMIIYTVMLMGNNAVLMENNVIIRK